MRAGKEWLVEIEYIGIFLGAKAPLQIASLSESVSQQKVWKYQYTSRDKG